jgi:signal peptidase I
MALTGVIQRRDKKSVIIENPPRVGEIVYALDTEEYGSLQNGTLIWKKFDDIVKSVAGRTGDIVLIKNDVGLGNVDNTSDLDKPINTATQTAIDTHEATINAHHVTVELLNLENVDNTSDLDKPVSTATQTAIDEAAGNITEVDNALKLNGLPASEYALVADYFTKVETENLLSAKANVDVSYTKAEDDNLLSAKTNQSDFILTKQKVQTLEISDSQKAEKTYVDNELDKKADKTDVNTLSNTVDSNKTEITQNTTDIASNKNDIDVLKVQKADKTYVDTQDTNIQTQVTTNTNDIANLVAGGVTKSYVDDADTILTNDITDLQTNKADKSYVDTQDTSLENDITDLQSTKADKTYVDTQDNDLGSRIDSIGNDKADKSYVDTQDNALDDKISDLQSTKADITYVDTQDNNLQTSLQSNIDNVNTDLQSQITTNKSNITDLMSDSVTKTYVDTQNTTLQTEINNLDTNKADITYVDSMVSGLDAKEAVEVATTENIDLGTGGLLTIDGVTLIAGDRVLVKNQTNTPDNGIYDAASGAWSRSADADNDPGSEVNNGMYCFVTDGTVNANTGWILSASDPITLGTTELIFNKFTNVIISASDILTKLLTVDGSGSGLDADLLDGLDSTQFAILTQNNVFTNENTFKSNSTFGSVDKNVDNILNMEVGDSNKNLINMTTNGQGSSEIFLGRDNNNGAGFLYNGDDAPDDIGNSNDFSAIRTNDGTRYQQFYWNETSADVTFTGDVIANSDKRVKDNIRVIDNAMSKISKINGVTFNRTDIGDTKTRYAGVIAQDVQKVLPEVVKEDKNGKLSVAYGNMVSILIEGLKEQQKEIDKLKKLINLKG